MTDCVVAPFDQMLFTGEEDVNTTEPPAQNVVGPPAVMVGTAGKGFTTILVMSDVERQSPVPTVTL